MNAIGIPWRDFILQGIFSGEPFIPIPNCPWLLQPQEYNSPTGIGKFNDMEANQCYANTFAYHLLKLMNAFVHKLSESHVSWQEFLSFWGLEQFVLEYQILTDLLNCIPKQKLHPIHFWREYGEIHKLHQL